MHLGGDQQFVGFDNRPYGDFTGTGGHQFDPIPTPKSRGSPAAAKGGDTGGLYGHRYDPQSPDRRAPDPWQSLTPDAGVSEVPESLLQERTVVDETISFLRGLRHTDPDRPWFLCASFSRPHYPLTAPERHVKRHTPEDVSHPRIGREGDAADHLLVENKAQADATADLLDPEMVELEDEELIERTRAAYFACVDFLDEMLGDLLATLDREGFLEDTIVVYASDTGQLAGEHGLWWTETWHEDAIRVPWIIELPEHRDGTGGEEISTPVSLVDLYPTLCGLAGTDAPGDLDGVDLTEAVAAGTEPSREPIFVDYLLSRWGEGTEFRLVRDGSHKYVRFHDAPDLLFDPEENPLETEDRSEDRSTTANCLRQLVDESIDFQSVIEQRDHDRKDWKGHELPTTWGTTGNAYLLDDGRLIDADVTLYRPGEIAVETSRVIDDWPERGDE
jgi:choline-sulfatase